MKNKYITVQYFNEDKVSISLETIENIFHDVIKIGYLGFHFDFKDILIYAPQRKKEDLIKYYNDSYYLWSYTIKTARKEFVKDFILIFGVDNE